MIHEFQQISDELAHRYMRLKEDAIYRAIMNAEGEIPPPSVIAFRGLFVCARAGDDSYEEFRWNNKPRFQIRIRWEKMKVWVEVKDL